MTYALGITGGIGSGKSTVCNMLAKFGARTFDADLQAKQLMTSDVGVRHEITDAFGVDSYTKSGDLNTMFLAEEIFSDPEKVAQVNEIIHPRVLARFGQFLELARKDGVPLVVMEAALIYESGADALLDAVVVVDAAKNLRLKRVARRDGVEEKDVERRMRYQLTPAELRRRADHIIRNNGSLEELHEQVARLYRSVLGG